MQSSIITPFATDAVAVVRDHGMGQLEGEALRDLAATAQRQFDLGRVVEIGVLAGSCVGGVAGRK